VSSALSPRLVAIKIVHNMITMAIRGLAKSTTENSLATLFSPFGVVHSVKLSMDLFTGNCRGFAEVKMEGHEARNAMAALNFREVDGSVIRVDTKRDKKGRSRPRR
jgi:RNA recognition motif-containing protein